MRLLNRRTPTWLRDLNGAWIFYTLLPGCPWPRPTFQRIARFAPLIGIFIGTIQSSLWIYLTQFDWPKESLALLTISAGALITGGIHLDGLMDTADGIGAGRKKCFEAMEDSRVGASALQALLIIICIQVAAIIKLGSSAPIAFPIALFWARCAPLWAIEKFPYIKKDGSAAFHRMHWKGLSDLQPALAILVITFLFLMLTNKQIPLMIGIGIGIVPALAIPELIGRYLKGHSGDSYGASLVLVETIMLLLLSMILPEA